MAIKKGKQRVRENLILNADAKHCAYCQIPIRTPQVEHNGKTYCDVQCYEWDNNLNDPTIVEAR